MITIDVHKNEILVLENGVERMIPFGSREAFELLSQLWLRAGWDTKYVYTFSWFGRPIIQLPEDMIRMQEVLYRLKPDVLIETGVAHGGSLIFYASIFKAMGRGRVIGVDIEIRKHNRKAIEAHEFSSLITLIEGSSTDADVVSQVSQSIVPGEKVLVILDSCHTRDHVRAELEAYGPLVSKDSYIVATDGIMKDLAGAPRSAPDWEQNNPWQAANDFLSVHPEFTQEQPEWVFDESEGLKNNVTYWPGAWLRRIT